MPGQSVWVPSGEPNRVYREDCKRRVFGLLDSFSIDSISYDLCTVRALTFEWPAVFARAFKHLRAGCPDNFGVTTGTHIHRPQPDMVC